MTADITIVIPCSENPQLVLRSVEGNKEIYSKYPMIVVSKNGGGPFLRFSPLYFKQDTSWWFARRFGLEFVKTKYVLCLDVDTILPPQYIEQAVELLEKDPKIGAVALNYAPPSTQNHLAFGTSIWRTEELKNLYDWRLVPIPSGIKPLCECEYMWNKLTKLGLKVETLQMQATHIKNLGAPKIEHS